MPNMMRVAGVQQWNAVGDIEQNAERIRDAMRWAEKAGVDVLVFGELALTGYPLADLALHAEFVADAREALEQLAAESGDVVSIVGTVERVPPQQTWDSNLREVSISSALLSGGEIRGVYHKVLLPTSGGYGEGRVFAPGRKPDALWRIGDVVCGVSICEDLWSGDGPPEAQSAAGARILLAPNASPYWRGKADARREMTSAVARRNGVPVVYVNLVGGQDELVFDGGSLIVDHRGDLVYRSPEFVEDRFIVDVELPPARTLAAPVRNVHTRPRPERSDTRRPPPAPTHEQAAGVWQALVTGTRDFAVRNGFSQALLGLSGGLDSAVACAVAADALGPENVLAISMPTDDSPQDEQRDAELIAANLGVQFRTTPITKAVAALRAIVCLEPGDPISGATRADLAARVRASILSAISDEHGHLVLATGNKTELSVGGGALAGDLTGEFAPLADCPKTLLYELARYRNRSAEVIAERVLQRQTTAQRTGDDWPPPYEVLDAIVERYIERDMGLEEIVKDGFDADLAVEVLRRIDEAEFKRRQIPPGVKVTVRAFTHDRHMPISNGWRAHRRGDLDASRTPAGPLTPTESEVAFS